MDIAKIEYVRRIAERVVGPRWPWGWLSSWCGC